MDFLNYPRNEVEMREKLVDNGNNNNFDFYFQGGEEFLQQQGNRPIDLNIQHLLFTLNDLNSSSTEENDYSASSSPMMEPNYSDSTPPRPTDGPLQVTLFHKPRGSQGLWQPVLHGEGLRVTKGRKETQIADQGKRTHLERTRGYLFIGLNDVSLPNTIEARILHRVVL